MREVISTVYELADLGVTIVPVKSQTGPVNTAMGRLLWAIQAARNFGPVALTSPGKALLLLVP